MTAVADRPGHDRRYALSSAKIEAETGWKPQVDFDDGLAVTVAWYPQQPRLDRPRPLRRIRSYYEKNYGTVNPRGCLRARRGAAKREVL